MVVFSVGLLIVATSFMVILVWYVFFGQKRYSHIRLINYQFKRVQTIKELHQEILQRELDLMT